MPKIGVNSGEALGKYVPGTVEHWIVRDFYDGVKVQPHTPRVVVVNDYGWTIAGPGKVTLTYSVERYADAHNGPTPETVAVQWGGHVHLFDRTSGKCIESHNGVMREWRLHPFEVATNPDLEPLDFRKDREARPIERVPAHPPAQPERMVVRESGGFTGTSPS